jgi:hypothetical protein
MFCRIKKCILPVSALIVMRVKEVLNIFQIYCIHLFLLSKFGTFFTSAVFRSSVSTSLSSSSFLRLLLISWPYVIFKNLFFLSFSFRLPTQLSRPSPTDLFIFFSISACLNRLLVNVFSVGRLVDVFPIERVGFFRSLDKNGHNSDAAGCGPGCGSLLPPPHHRSSPHTPTPCTKPNLIIFLRDSADPDSVGLLDPDSRKQCSGIPRIRMFLGLPNI